MPFTEPREFHFDYELLVKAAVTGQLLGAGPEFLCALSAAVYASGRWPIDRALVIEIAAEHSLDTGEFDGVLASDGVAARLAASASEAFERGAFGVPTFFLGSRMFWGNDRIPLLRHALATHAG